MLIRNMTPRSKTVATLLLSSSLVSAGPWAEWGGGPSKNMISGEKGLPVELDGGEEDEENEKNIDLSTTKNCKWVVTLGSESYGSPTIAKGRVLVGTNNENPRNPAIEGDRGVVMAFSEKEGKFLWQLTVPKLPGGDDIDWEYLGICSSTLLDGDRGYVLSNRGEVVCLDLKGLADGNDGCADEAKFMTSKAKEKIVPGPTDADILWTYDMPKSLGVVPHNITSSSITMVNGIVFATTSNGVDGEHEETPAPEAPCLISLDAKTGTLLGKEQTGISKRMFHCNWSSPCIGQIDGKPAVFFGAGDGFLYAFDATAEKTESGDLRLKERWRIDANAKAYRHDDKGEPRDYPSFKGPSEIVGTPVFADGKVYVTIGQDPENGDGVGMLSCVDAKTGKADWTYEKISRSLSTPSVTKDLVLVSDFSGQIHCVDVKTGKQLWVHDTLSRIWGSTLVADGKVYIGTEDGELVILKEGRELEEVGTAQFTGPIYSSPVAANGRLYIQTQTHLYAFEKK